MALVVLCSSLADDFASRVAREGLLRPAALRQAERGQLWPGARPGDDAIPDDPQEMIEFMLSALRRNDEPERHSGTALLRRFATDDFALAGEPTQTILQPPQLTEFFQSTQYGLLLEDETVMQWSFPQEPVSLDDSEAWQEVWLEGTGGQGKYDPQAPMRSGDVLAKLGWSLRRTGRFSNCWLTEAITWHDFRPAFRPGIGEEEWDRSFG